MDVGLDEEVVNVLVIQEAAREGDGSSHAAGDAGDAEDVTKLFGDFEDEVEPEVGLRDLGE